jgi:hypothetical protein
MPDQTSPEAPVVFISFDAQVGRDLVISATNMSGARSISLSAGSA